MNALLQELSSCETYLRYVENVYKNKYIELLSIGGIDNKKEKDI